MRNTWHRALDPPQKANSKQRIKELIGDASATGSYGCPVCGMTVAGADLTRHVDEHRSDEIGGLDPATLTLEAREQDLGQRYGLGEVIGGQGTSWVRLATDLLANQTVVVKQLMLSFRATFQLRQVAAFDHRGIVRILDIGKSYIVLEYVDGRLLSDVLKSDGLMKPLRAAKIMADVCDALAYGNKRGVNHGDINSRNVMLTRNGTVKVLNFGKDFRIGHAADEPDVYSAGCLLSELLSGVPSATTLGPPIPRALIKIAHKATHVNPAKQYRSTAEMRDALRRVL